MKKRLMPVLATDLTYLGLTAEVDRTYFASASREYSVELISVAAIAENLVIGSNGEVPWPHIPEDVDQYRARVAHSPVILGRRTYESMRGDLPGSYQIVISRQLDEALDTTAVVAADVESAIAYGMKFLSKLPTDETNDSVYVLGGGAIYDLFLPYLDRMVLSHVHGSYEGDSQYPAWDETEWEIISEADYDAFTLREWGRQDERRDETSTSQSN